MSSSGESAEDGKTSSTAGSEGDSSSLNSFLYLALTSLRKASGRKHKELRAALEEHIAAVQDSERRVRSDPANIVAPTDADGYFLCFKLACDTSSAKLKAIALDSIQKLVAGGYLTGESVADVNIYGEAAGPGAAGNGAQSQQRRASSAKGGVSSFFNGKSKARQSAAVQSASDAQGASESEQNGEQNGDQREHKEPRKLINVIIQTIYSCSMYEDDNVQLQVIKCLLTCVNSSTCKVHDHALLLAIRACYHIFLMSRNMINQTTAKATLTQMLNTVFQSMEHHYAQMRFLETRVKQANELKDKLKTTTNVATLIDTFQSAGNPASTDQKGGENGNVPKVVRMEGGGKFGFCSVCPRPANHYCLETREPVCSVECKRCNLSALNYQNEVDVKTMTAAELIKHVDAFSDSRGDMGAAAQTEYHSWQGDGFLLFRALCKLTTKPLPSPTEPVALRSKTLSLELLLSVVQHSRTAFRNSSQFIQLVRLDLMDSLLENAVLPIEPIFKLSASIFVMLVAYFKLYLKHEIAIFLSSVFLRILNSNNSTYAHKMMALRVLSNLCGDPQTIVDMFVNYDCEEDSFQIYEDVVHALEHVSQGRFIHENWMTPEETAALKLMALQSLVATLDSLVSWSKKAENAAKPTPEGQDHQSDPDSKSSSSSTSSSAQDLSAPNPTRQSSQRSATNFKDMFDKQKAARKTLDSAILKFNMKPSKGLAYWTEIGLVRKDDAQSLAEFFYTHSERLDKALVGDFLGDPDKFNVEVCTAYAGLTDFTDMELDNAIRFFLTTFRLPVEAQKIDRVIQVFSDRYHDNNPGIFNSSETCCILSFSLIMLNTDLHNAMVKRKMTKDQFVSNNRGIDNGSNLPREYLERLYDNIANNEIKLKNDPFRFKEEREAEASLKPKTRVAVFINESKEMLKEARQLVMKKKITEKKHSPPKFYSATVDDVAAIVPMFDVLWYPAIAAFSMLLELSDDRLVIENCLKGYRRAVRISAAFALDTPRAAFVTSLKKFTLLGTGKEMKMKNIDAIQLLLQIAHYEGNYLRESWKEVLDCISEFERLHLIGIGQQPNVDIFQISPVVAQQQRSTAQNSNMAGQISVAEQRKKNILFNSQNVVAKVEPSLIDRIFTQSKYLRSEAIVEFVDALKQVSIEELNDPIAPRVFSLQKIVEITHYNIDRPRLVWKSIWDLLSVYFSEVGCNPNLNVSMYGIDSLKQLSMKFLEKEELLQHFQEQILAPFDAIMRNSASLDVKELVVQCIDRLIIARVDALREGWAVLLSVLKHASPSKQAPLVHSTALLFDKLMANHFSLISGNVDIVIDIIDGLAGNTIADIALAALDHLARCAAFAASDVQQDQLSKNGVEVFRQIVVCLCGFVDDARLEVRQKAVKVLFSVINEHGAAVSGELWAEIFSQHVFPVFERICIGDDVSVESKTAVVAAAKPETKHNRAKAGAEEWIATTFLSAMCGTADVFAHFLTPLTPIVGQFLELLAGCISQENEVLGCIGIVVWERFVSEAGALFSKDQWTQVAQNITHTLRATLPRELQSASLKAMLGLGKQRKAPSRPTSPVAAQRLETDKPFADLHSEADPTKNAELVLPFSPQGVDVKCKIQLMLIQATFRAIFEFYPLQKAYSSSNSNDSNGDKTESDNKSADGKTDGVTSNANFNERLLFDTSHFGKLRSDSVTLTVEHIFSVVDALIECASFYHSFNGDTQLRVQIGKASFYPPSVIPASRLSKHELRQVSESRKQPNLFYHQAHAQEVVLKILFHMLEEFPDAEHIEQRLLVLIETILARYVERTSLPDTQTVEVLSLDIAMAALLHGLIALHERRHDSESTFLQRHLATLHPSLSRVIGCGSSATRQTLVELFLALGPSSLSK